MTAKKKPAADKAAEAARAQKAAEVAIEKALLAADFKQVDDLIPYARNAKKHPPEQVARLAGLIEEFGWTNPVLADAKGIVAGHGRVMAARKLYEQGRIIRLPNGIEIPPGTVPVLDCTGWSDEKRRLYIIADNQSAVSDWDTDLLKLELSDLASFEFNMDLLGFSDDELAKINAPPKNAGLTNPDEEQAVPAVPVTRLGDVWVMGRHRIICGDATNPEAVDRVLAGAAPKLMVTDPPYGVEYDPEWRLRAGVNKPHQVRAEGKVENDDRADWREAWDLFRGDVAYVWHGGLHSAVVAASLEACDFVIRSQIIWAKASLVMGRGHYHWQHEPCWYAVRDGATGHWQGDRKQSTIWEIANMHATQGKVDDGKRQHSTQKPVECMRRPIENNSLPGAAVYEPFSGSGTTIIACEMTGRACHAVELNPAYVDVAVTRWERFTGQAAVLEGDGRSWAEVMAERCPAGQVAVRVRGPRRGKGAGGAAEAGDAPAKAR